MRGWWLAALLGVVGVVGVVAAPLDARACGGTFCDGSGPVPMPVDQTGENILFIRDGTAIEAHIQIQYTGEPQRFAWVVPMPSIPTFRIGSDLLFRELLRSTVPTYTLFSTQQEQCAEDYAFWLLASPALLAVPIFFGAYFPLVFFWVVTATLGQGCAADMGSTGGDAEASGVDGRGAAVVFRESVGAFDITVLQAGNADEVIQWLNDNQYTVTPNTAPLIRQYAEENSLFAAIKLESTAQVDEIHPIVLRYEYGVPCIPLRLTAVAATQDMGVRAFFLGDARTVPQAYRHVEVNPLQIDWLNSASNYMQVVSRAVDDVESGGQGFVTEYAGPSSVMQQQNWFWWGGTRMAEDIAARDVVPFLEFEGLMSCNGGFGNQPPGVQPVTPENSCTFFHPLVRPLLQDHLPPPSDLTEFQYWSNVAAFTTAPPGYNPAALAQDFEDRINEPARRVAALTVNRPYLTRLFTTISPDEMTLDPEFHERPDLPDVDNTRQQASSIQRCDGFTSVSLPDGRTVELPQGSAWPTFDGEMPWALKVEDISHVTDIDVLADRTLAADKALSNWNSRRAPAPADVPSRCSCASPADARTPWAGFVLAGVVLLLARRRR